MKWRKIETAPVDARDILVAFKGQFKWVYFTAIANGVNTHNDRYANPTHWTNIEEPKNDND